MGWDETVMRISTKKGRSDVPKIFDGNRLFIWTFKPEADTLQVVVRQDEERSPKNRE